MHCDVVFLSVKPHLIVEVINQVKLDVRPGSLYISVAAGITIETMENVSHLFRLRNVGINA